MTYAKVDGQVVEFPGRRPRANYDRAKNPVEPPSDAMSVGGPELKWDSDSPALKITCKALTPLLEYLQRRFGLGTCGVQLLIPGAVKDLWSLVLSAEIAGRRRQMVIMRSPGMVRRVWG